MTKMEKCFVGMGVCTSALLVVGFGMVLLHPPRKNEAPVATAQTAPAPNASQDQSSWQSAAPQPAAQPFNALAKPLPANAAFIPDEYLEQLSVMVNLASAKNQAPDKNVWAQVTPIAEKLMNGPCDCAQKIWLKHFVEMGNYALSGSTGEYHDTAGVLITLGRNDTQAMELSKKPKQN